MAKFNLPWVKDLGLQRKVMDALPYAVVGGAWEGSLTTALDTAEDFWTVLNHIVPTGHQLKILFLRVWTQNTEGAKFSIYQTKPTGPNQTGTTEAHPVVGSVEYDSDSPPGTGPRDYPMLEADGAEVLHGGLRTPVHVLEGSIDFRIVGPVAVSGGDRYGVVWRGVEKIPE